MNASRERDRVRRKFQYDLLESFRRICDANLSRRNRVGKIERNKNGRGARFSQERAISRVGIECDLVCGGLRQRGCARNFLIGIAVQFAARHLR